MFKPRRAVVMAASHPAWPPPTTITSKCSVGAAEKLMPSLSVGAALSQGVLRELVVLLLITSGEMAAATEAHVSRDCSDAAQSQSKAALWIQ